MTATMTLEVLSPAGTRTIAGLIRMRFDAPDGSRGVLPGHEPSRAEVSPGPIEVVGLDGHSRFLATEGGVAWIDRDHVRLASPWATEAADLTGLREAVAERSRFRRRVEHEARATARRHEKATQRALVALRRGGGR